MRGELILCAIVVCVASSNPNASSTELSFRDVPQVAGTEKVISLLEGIRGETHALLEEMRNETRALREEMRIGFERQDIAQVLINESLAGLHVSVAALRVSVDDIAASQFTLSKLTAAVDRAHSNVRVFLASESPADGNGLAASSTATAVTYNGRLFIVSTAHGSWTAPANESSTHFPFKKLEIEGSTSLDRRSAHIFYAGSCVEVIFVLADRMRT